MLFVLRSFIYLFICPVNNAERMRFVVFYRLHRSYRLCAVGIIYENGKKIKSQFKYYMYCVDFELIKSRARVYKVKHFPGFKTRNAWWG